MVINVVKETEALGNTLTTNTVYAILSELGGANLAMTHRNLWLLENYRHTLFKRKSQVLS